MNAHANPPPDPWGPYVNYDDVARLDYGRRMWRLPDMRRRLAAHWVDERHPHRERFLANRILVVEILTASESDADLDCRLRERGISLRAAVREIPPVFGSFF